MVVTEEGDWLSNRLHYFEMYSGLGTLLLTI